MLPNNVSAIWLKLSQEGRNLIYFFSHVDLSRGTLNLLNHFYLSLKRSISSRLLRQSVIRGHRRNDATLSLFVVIDAVPHSRRRGQENAHRKNTVVTAIALLVDISS